MRVLIPLKFLRLFAGAAVMATLAGCQDSGLDLSAQAAKKIVVGPSVPVAIESLDGPPNEVAPRFSAALAAEAQSREIAFVDRDQAPRFRLRGYLSATQAGEGTAVLYVFDLFDQGQRRAQRVSGSELVKKQASEPWQAIDDAALRRIASRSMNEVAEFLVAQARQAAPVAGRATPAQNPRASAGDE